MLLHFQVNSLGSLIKSIIRGHGKYSWSSLGQVLQVFLHKSSLKSMENPLGTSRINTFKLHYGILARNQWKILQEIPGVFLIKILFQSQSHQFLRVPLSTRIRNLHKMLLELPGPIPLHFFIKSVLKSMVNALGACWSISLPKIIGKCSWSLLVRSFGPPLSKSSLAIHEMSLEIHRPIPSHFLIKS